MKKSGWRLGAAIAILGWAGWILLTATSSATMPIEKKAKELGFPAENCLYCHSEKMPKKGAVTYNERGKWLQSEKERLKAKEVDAAWLKDYPGDKK